MSITDVPFVELYKSIIESHIRRLNDTREYSDVDSPILETDCADLLNAIRSFRSENESQDNLPVHNAAVETVFRHIFIDIVATVDISEPAFSQVWILLDIITILSDNELCEPGLGFWLVEELLDSQTIDGCRKVFDYLDSRRERITAKHFKHKSLVILRCCNELLRRLSRAEDTVFCGRVFIFLFQSFPLGDKSSVNLRGEFHVENVTTFDLAPKKSEDAIKPMELDTETPQATSGAQTPASSSQVQDQESTQKTARGTPVPKAVKPDPKESPPDLDELYPKFWSLQTFFSSPTRLFEPSSMAAFKDGLASTLSCFKFVANNSAPSTNPVDLKRGLKRKRTEMDTSASTSPFNPKYLTNRDLFDLEVHDIAFRRHVLVQALIMIDFLLSLAPAAKARFEGLTNKSVLYTYTLSEEDTKWAQSSRAAIASYLQQGNGNEGKFYYRMVDTVLSRDKNWVRWKAENCPSISHESISAQAYVEARSTLTKMTETKKSRLPDPPGASDLAYLSKAEPLQALKNPSNRHKTPTVEEYYRGIETDELDLDFAVTGEERKEIEERKAGKVWRALRASGRQFALSEKVQYGGNLKALVEREEEVEGEKPPDVEEEAGTEADAGEKASDRRNEDEDDVENATTGQDLGEGRAEDEVQGEADQEVSAEVAPEADDAVIPDAENLAQSTGTAVEDAEMTDVAAIAEGETNEDDDGDRDSGEAE